jgi:hypothetical protein
VSLLRKRIIVSGWLLGLYLSCFCAVHAQMARMLGGNVQDVTGGIIAGADVTLFSDDRVLTTKTDEGGIFRFPSLPPQTRYVEVSSLGFFPRSIALTDQSPERISFTLWEFDSGPHVVVTECKPQMQCEASSECGSPNHMLPSSVSYYGERIGKIQVTGIVSDVSGSRLGSTSITLSLGDLDASRAVPDRPRGVAMKDRFVKESVVARGISTEKGEFQFADLEPGWYTLQAAHDGYSNAIAKFWVAREGVARLSPIYLYSVPPHCQ